jgi:DNA repair protein RadC
MNEPFKPVYRIADLVAEERPRERLERWGSQVLSNAELLAILLRVGVTGESAVQVGQRLMSKYQTLAKLHQAPFEELCNQHGIGKAKAAQIKAAIELGKRMAEEPAEKHVIISRPEDAVALVAFDMSALEQEHLRVLLLDTRNQLLDIVEVYKGSVNTSQVHVGELFKPAIRRNASAMIVVHNHPSGDPTPSPDDIAVTRSIIQAGKLLDVDVLDHMIIGRGKGKWVSLKERGLGFG